MLENPIKKVAAFHDISTYGKVSLKTVIPILSTMGIEVNPFVTSVLSSNTEFSGFHYVDLSSELIPIMDHLESLNASFDAVYSGFLGGSRQVDIVLDFFSRFHKSGQLKVVDPVLGDNNELYEGIGDDLVEKMKELVKKADVVTPNLTELGLLLDKSYSENISKQEIKEDLWRLTEDGPKIAIVTSVPKQNNQDITSTVAFNSLDNRFWCVNCHYLPKSYPGTGDIFASVLVGSLLQGDSLPQAIDRAVSFILQAIRATFGYNTDQRSGVFLERVLHTLNFPVQLSSYELY
jgi:pyridoxine kinase